MRISTQTENQKQRKNVTTDKKYIIWKKFQNTKFNLLCITGFLFWFTSEPLGLRGQWGQSGK